jgi:restriction system protein
MSKGITRERTGQILQELFKVLLSKPDGIQARDAIEAVASKLQLTDHEKGEYESGARRFDKILRFATVDAVKAGWMLKNKGIWSITEQGKEALQNFRDPEDFYREATRLYRQWRLSNPVAEDEDRDESTPEVAARITFEEAEEQAWKEIRAYLDAMDPFDLQDMVAALLQAMGYHITWIAPRGKDGGIDILAWNDPLGTKPPRIKVQVKRRKDNIPIEELRSFISLINEDDVGIFVTTGGFTRDAEEYARNQERRKITLIDSEKLVELWTEYGEKLESDTWEFLPLSPIFFLTPRS